MNSFSRILLPLILFVFGAASSLAREIFVSQVGSGTQTGADSANSRSVVWLNTAANWTSNIGPGDTVHLVGVITNRVIISGSGVEGAPITILFEQDARLESPAWDANGAISASSKKWLVIDGGVNGLIHATDNGTEKSLKVVGSRGVNFSNVESSIIRNLTVTNLYVRMPGSSDSISSGYCISLLGNSSNNEVYGNRCGDGISGISWSFGSNQTNRNVMIYSNIISRCSGGIIFGSGGINAIAEGVSIFGNRISGAFVWDGTWTPPPGDGHHHSDGIHLWAMHSGSSVTSLQIFGNHIGPDMGSHITAWIFIEERLHAPHIWGNILTCDSTSGPANGFIFLKGSGVGCNGGKIFNNTVSSMGRGSGVGLSSCTNVTIVNNIFDGVATVYSIPNTPIGFADYNLVNKLGANQVYYTNGFYKWSSWRSTKPYDAMSISNSTLLQADFTIPTNSPAFRGGIAVTDVDERVFATRPRSGIWSIGAIEPRSRVQAPGNLRAFP